MLKVFKRAVRSRSGAALVIVLGLAFVFCGALYVRFSGTAYLVMTVLSGLMLAGTVTWLSARAGSERKRQLDGILDGKRPAFQKASQRRNTSPPKAQESRMRRFPVPFRTTD